MKLPILDIKNTALNQLSKIREEFNEVHEAEKKMRLNPYNYIKHKENLLEESLDLIQATITLILNEFIEDEIKEGLEAHYKKLSSRKNKIIGSINFEVKFD